MGRIRGFLERGRELARRRPPEERIGDFQEFEGHLPEPEIRAQAGRCMDCGVPFCHAACPLGNDIPDFDDLVYRGRWKAALERLHATNNFPEFTGRICPAPCEASCVLNRNDEPVSIEQIERHIADRGWEEGWIAPRPAAERSGRSVAVIGSGPAGLTAAQQLARVGHDVVVYERADRPGGLLRYGIPDFKLDKGLVDRRVAQLEAEGVVFRCGVEVGVDVSGEQLRAEHDAVLLATGSAQPRDLSIPGRDLDGVHLAMDFLVGQNRRVAGLDVPDPISARGLDVVVLGGGDTGSDCLGTSLRQGARSVRQWEILPRPPASRSADEPWPAWPRLFRVSSSQEEGGERDFSVRTVGFEGDDRVRRIRAVRVEWEGRRMVDVPGSSFTVDADLVLLALGFVGVEEHPLIGQLGVAFDGRRRLETERYGTRVPGVFACGDARRGQSLVVWAIREGRDAAERVDRFLTDRRAPELPWQEGLTG